MKLVTYAWIIRLKGTDDYLNDVNYQWMNFNTKKFQSYQAARAYCRETNRHPSDYEIIRAKFEMEVIEVKKIDYSDSELNLAD